MEQVGCSVFALHCASRKKKKRIIVVNIRLLQNTLVIIIRPSYQIPDVYCNQGVSGIYLPAFSRSFDCALSTSRVFIVELCSSTLLFLLASFICFHFVVTEDRKS